MSKSIKYSNISGLEGNNYVFEFINDDAGDLRLIGIFKDNSILNPALDEWMIAKDSEQALSAYNDELEKSIDLEKDLTQAMMKEDEEEPTTTQLKGASKDSIAVLARKLQQVSSELKTTANKWKKTEGGEKEELKNRLLTLTKIKKELESMLE